MPPVKKGVRMYHLYRYMCDFYFWINIQRNGGRTGIISVIKIQCVGSKEISYWSSQGINPRDGQYGQEGENYDILYRNIPWFFMDNLRKVV